MVGDGIDADGNEVLTWIEGDFVHPHAWSDEEVWQVGRLLRDLHAATAGFRPPPDAVCSRGGCTTTAPDSVIGHCDAGPWHAVARNGAPVAFID